MQERDEKQIEYKCLWCGAQLELILADEPWHDDYLLCPECDATFIRPLDGEDIV